MINPHRTRGFLFPDEELPSKKKKKPQSTRWVKFKDWAQRKIHNMKLENAFLALAAFGTIAVVCLVKVITAKDAISYCYITQGIPNNSSADKLGFYVIGNKDWQPDSTLAGPFRQIDEAYQYVEKIQCPTVSK